MRKFARLGAMLALGAAMLLPTLATAQAGFTRTKARFNFVSAGAAKAARQRAAIGNTRRVRAVPRGRGAGYAACRTAAQRLGVPVATALAVCRLESGFRCNAVGRAGELGLLQIKLATARALDYRGSRRGLLNCSTGAYWGMKHLAQAIRMGGVWKHNAGLYARRPNAQARKYARKVAALRRRYL